MIKAIFEQYAVEGENIDIMSALKLLAEAYISQCGVSISNRAVIYNAAEQWQERLAWEELPLSAKARKLCLVELMPLLSEDYEAEDYDHYDICSLNDDERLNYCLKIIEEQEFNTDTLKVMCWGIKKILDGNDFQPYKIEKKVVDDGNEIILSGLVTNQSISRSSVTMLSPYQVNGRVTELVVNATDFLERMYNQYLSVLSHEAEIRALYPTYIEQVKQTPHYRVYRLMKHTFRPMFNDDIIIDLGMVLEKEFGLRNIYHTMK